MKVCKIVGCINELPEDSSREYCRLCRGSTYYWNKKRPAQILERRRKLTMYSGRLDEFYINPSTKRRSK